MRKNLILVMFVALVAVPAAAVTPQFAAAALQACSELFFSEYVEGSSYNKALEIFNGSAGAVNLSAYSVELYSNGSPTPSQAITLAGTLAAGDVFVMAHPSAAADILNVADLLSSAVVNFNGDDAVVLKHSGAIIDVIGQIGFDPGTEWGTGVTSTADNTLRRKGSVSVGDTNGGDGFDPSVEWDGYATDTFDGLGAHSATCSGSGDVPPTVASTTPANGASGVAQTANVTITFSEPVTVTAGAWFNITCTASGAHTAVVSGGLTSYTLNPDSDFTLAESCTGTVYAAQVTDQDSTPDNMAADKIWSFNIVGAPVACSTIPQVQGNGNVSPCLGAVSDIEGCITGIGAAGFYMQAVGAQADGNVSTSDGIYVYRGSTWTNPSGWAPGNLVRVLSGTIIEYYDTTEFQSGNSVTRLDAGANCGGNGYPAPVAVTPIADPTADPMTLYERYEGMRVSMSLHGWIVQPTKRFISRFAVSDPELAFVDFSSSIPDYERVFEKDYLGYQGINYVSGGLNQDLPDVDFGDEISGTAISGVLGYQFSKYTLLVDAPPSLTVVDRPDVLSGETAANTANGEFDICFANVENRFDNINDGKGDWGDWAPGYPDSGTAVGLAAYQVSLAETAAVLVNEAKSCMVIGVEEMEGKQQVYNDLAAALHTADPTHTWSAAYVESGDARDISQGFFWRDDVTLLAPVSAVSGAPYTDWVSDHALNYRRISPTGLFRFNAGGPNQVDIRLYAMHFKSKGSSTSCSTPDCTDIRLLEAADTRDILAHHQGAGEFAIAGGDFNDTFGSTPIDIFDAISPTIKSLYYDLAERARYSYIFNGESEVLDHYYVTNNLLPATPGWGHSFSSVHVNADFPAAEHASDHDPLRARFIRCDVTAAPAGLAIGLTGATVQLNWTAVPNSAAYQVWRSDAPYFTPQPGTETPLGTVGIGAYPDANRAGAAPDYYTVTAANACGSYSPVPAGRVGEFSFVLIPGD